MPATTTEGAGTFVVLLLENRSLVILLDATLPDSHRAATSDVQWMAARGLATSHVDPSRHVFAAGPSTRSDGDAARRFLSWKARHNAVLTIATAGVGPILYLVFINQYATNSFYDDDWSVAPFVRDAPPGAFH